MSKNTYHQYLKQVPLFSDLDDDELDEVGAEGDRSRSQGRQRDHARGRRPPTRW